MTLLITSSILQIRKINNRADIDSIYKHIIKTNDFEDVAKEFLDDRIHTLINDEKITNKRNPNDDTYYVNTDLADTRALELCQKNNSKKSRYCETSTHYDDSKILIKSLNDQIDFLKSEIKSKNAIITMILDYHKNKMRQPK